MKYLCLALLLLCPALADPAEPVQTLLPRFEKIATELFQESGVPGMAIAIVSHGEVVYLKGFGVRQAGSSQAVDADTVFQLASCSKPMTSTALAMLVGQHKIAWDDHIHQVLPEFVVSDPWVTENLTYRDLLSHHSTLPGAAGDILENLGLERDEILARLRYLSPAYDFRAGYAYTNYGFTAGGEAAARVVGVPFEQMMEETLFKPAGMSSTSARFEDFQKASNRASTHVVEGGKAYPTLRMPQAQAPAGGVSSTARDMARWMQLHLGKGVLDGKKLADEMELAQTYRIHSLSGNNPASFSGSGYYGLGWDVGYDKKGRLRLAHSGAFLIGVRTSVTMLPQEETGIVVLTNAYPTAMPEALAAVWFALYDGQPADLELARKVNVAVLGILQSMFEGYELERPAKPVPARPLATYAGTYDHDYFGEAVVSKTADGLSLKIGRKTFPLEHLNGDVFVLIPPSRVYEDLTTFELQFVVDGQGRVVGFRQNGLAKVEPWFARR